MSPEAGSLYEMVTAGANCPLTSRAPEHKANKNSLLIKRILPNADELISSLNGFHDVEVAFGVNCQ